MNKYSDINLYIFIVKLDVCLLIHLKYWICGSVLVIVMYVYVSV